MDNPIKKMEIKINGNCEGNDLHLQDPETFETSWLRYFNCAKVDILEVSNCISSLNNMIKGNEDGSVELVIDISSDGTGTPQHSRSIKTLGFEKCRKKVTLKKASRQYPSANRISNLASCFSPNSSDSSSGFCSSQKSVSPVEIFLPTTNEEKNKREKRSLSEMKSSQFSIFNQLSYEKDRRISPYTPAAESNSCVNPTKVSSDRQSLLSLLNETDEASSTITKRQQSYDKDCRVSPHSPASENNSCMTPIKVSSDQQPLLSLLDDSDEASSPKSKRRLSYEKDCRVSPHSPASENKSCMTPTKVSSDQQPLLSLLDDSDEASSPKSKRRLSYEKDHRVSPHSPASERNSCINPTKVLSDRQYLLLLLNESDEASSPESKRQLSHEKDGRVTPNSPASKSNSCMNPIKVSTNRQSLLSLLNESDEASSPVSKRRLSYEKDRRVLPHSPASESNSCMNPKVSSDQQPLLSLLDDSDEASSPKSKRRLSYEKDRVSPHSPATESNSCMNPTQVLSDRQPLLSLLDESDEASSPMTTRQLSCEKDRRVSPHSPASESNCCINPTKVSSDRQYLLSLLNESDEASSPVSKRQLSYQKDGRVTAKSPASKNNSCMNPSQTSSDLQPLLSFLDEPDEASSPISERHHSDSPEIRHSFVLTHAFSENGISESILDELLPVSDREYTLTPEHHFSESILESILDEPIPDCNLPPPLIPIPFNRKHSLSIASNSSPSSLLSNQKELDLPNPNPSSFVSLLPNQLREDIGKNIIQTMDIYHIIIDKKIDWITGIENEMGVAKISEIGGELLQVRRHFADHLMYYNTYFPFLLLECFCKISLVWKEMETQEKLNRNICKIVHSEVKQRYVSFQCESFIRHSDEENFAKEGDIILANFYTDSADNVRLLGYVCSSVLRPYSHRRDKGHEMLKYVNAKKRKNVKKIKIKFHTVFDFTNVILDLPIYFFKLMSFRETLKLNEALKKIRRSPLCEAVLRPWRNNIKRVVVPSYQDVNAMTAVTEGIFQSLDPLSSQMTVVKCSFFMDSIIAIVQIVEKMKNANIRGQMLICVREEFLSPMGMNLIKTSSNIVIISRKSKKLHVKLENRVLGVMVTNLTKDIPQIPDDIAQTKVLQEADVLLAITETCFDEQVKSTVGDIAYCIIHDAHTFMEPVSLLPLLYGVRHLILFGDPDESCDINSQYAASLGYSKSLFHRACELP